MPLVRAQVRNEYGLGQPELYNEVNREDPKAVLDGVAVAGLVGILRQLGDLAEFAAEVFHGLQEQVMSTGSRSHKLTIRLQRIEAALPPLEKAVLAQTSHIHFAYTAGSEWHTRFRSEKNLFIYNDLPRFIMDSYEVGRDPPRLHLLDKFDAGGPGSCLKRYSDPTFFKRASGSSIKEDSEKVPRDKRNRKSKKRRSSSHRNGKLSRGTSLSSRSGRMQFTPPIAPGRTSSQNASTVDLALKSDAGEHSSSFDSKTGSGYIESAFNLGSSMLPEELEPKELSSRLLQETDTLGSNFPVEQTRVLDDNFSHGSSQKRVAPSSSCVTWDEKVEIVDPKAGNWDIDEVSEVNFDVDVQEIGVANLVSGDQVDIPFNDMGAPQSSPIEKENDEIESEPDNYMDALNTIESESENDIECHRKQVEQCSEKDVECQTKWEVEQSEDANVVSNETREDEQVVMDDNADCNPSIIEPSASSNISSNNGMLENSPDPVPPEDISCEQMLQISCKSSDPDHSPNTGFYISDEIHNIPQAESIISELSSSSGSRVSDMHEPASDSIMNSVNDSQNSQTESSVLHPVGLWTNGSLLGLQPSKPPDFAVSTVGQGSAAKTSETFGPLNQMLMALPDGPKGNSGAVVGNAEFNEKVPGLRSEKTSCLITYSNVNLEKHVNSHCNDSLDNLNGVGLSLNTSLPHGNKPPVGPSIKSTSIESDEENDDNSSRMFGLGHKLLVNGFRRKMSIGHDDESEPATSTKTGVLEPRSVHQGLSYQKIPRKTVNEQIGNGSPVNSLTSSPPLEHMKISFNPIHGFETSKLKLQFPDGNHYQENIRDTFPSFQLVPVPGIPVHDVASDSDDDTFCRSSPYMSDDSLSHCSESNSEQWESGETPESKDPDLYDALSRLSSMESVSSSLKVGEASNSGICVNVGNKTVIPGSGEEPSLSVSLDFPSFDVSNPILHDETKSNSDKKSQLNLQNTTEFNPLPPPPPPAQWRVSKPCFVEAEERQHALSDSLRHELDLKLLGSFVSQQPDPPSVTQKQISNEAIALKPEKKVGQDKLNRPKEAKQLSGGQAMDDEKEDFLHQIRSKSFNLRPTVATRPTAISGPAANVQVTAILQKANAIRQAVGTDDDDNWSDN